MNRNTGTSISKRQLQHNIHGDDVDADDDVYHDNYDVDYESTQRQHQQQHDEVSSSVILPSSRSSASNPTGSNSSRFVNNNNFAIVPKTLPILINSKQKHENKVENQSATSSRQYDLDSTRNNRNDDDVEVNDDDDDHNKIVQSIYEQYATIYPNPALQQEFAARDQLIQAITAADHARLSSTGSTVASADATGSDDNNNIKKKSFFSRLFGSSSGNKSNKKVTANNAIDTSTIENRLLYKDIDEAYIDTFSLCGTTASLDSNAIPLEAHSVVRYHLACTARSSSNSSSSSKSTRIQFAIPRISPTVVHYPSVSSSITNVSSSVIMITGLGEFLENTTTDHKEREHKALQNQKDENNSMIYDNNKNNDDATSTTIHYSTDRDQLRQQVLSSFVGFDVVEDDNNNNDDKIIASLFRLDYTRAIMFGPNCIAVSWGFVKNCTRTNVILYRRSILENNDGKQQKQKQKLNQHTSSSTTLCWHPVAWIGTTRAVQEYVNDDDVFATTATTSDTSTSSPLLNITDIVPILVPYPNDDDLIEIEHLPPPAASIAISRLGGYVEVVPIPPDVWYGPSIINPPIPPSMKKANQNKNKKNKKIQSLYLHDLPNLAYVINPKLIVTIATSEYHNDIMGLEIMSCMSILQNTPERNNSNPTPSADHVLIIHGARNVLIDNDDTTTPQTQTQRQQQVQLEAISFWSINTIFDPKIQGIGHVTNMTIVEALDLSETISHQQYQRTYFTTDTIMQYWRKPRNVELKAEPSTSNKVDEAVGGSLSVLPINENNVSSSTSDNNRVTTISVAIPIQKVQTIISSTDSAAAIVLLDANGGTTILRCDLLVRTVTNTLTDDDQMILLSHSSQQYLQQDDEYYDDGIAPPPPPYPLVDVVHNHLYILEKLLQLQRTNINDITSQQVLFPPRIVDVHWMNIVKTRDGAGMINDVALLLLVDSGYVGSRSLLSICLVRDLFLHLTGDDTNVINDSPVVESALSSTVTTAALLRLHNNDDLYLAIEMTASSSRSMKSNRKKSRRTMWSKSNNGVSIQLCAVHKVEPSEIIQSLVASKKYIEAIQAYNDHYHYIISSGSQSEIRIMKEMIESCKQNLWVEQLDIRGLESVKDDTYVIEQVLAMVNANQSVKEVPSMHNIIVQNDIKLFRAACQIAITRLDRTSNLALYTKNETNTKLVTIRNATVRLGTYLILCIYFDIEPQLYHFMQEFLSVPVAKLAIGLGKKSLIGPLSVLFYRHPKEVYGNLQILDSLPLNVSPILYQHLLPVFNNVKMYYMSDLALSAIGVTLPRIQEYDKLPEYLNHKFELDSFIDDEDRINIGALSNGRNPDKTIDWSTHTSWYEQRSKSLRGSSLDDVYIFEHLAACASISQNVDASGLIKSIAHNRKISVLQTLRLMSNDTVIQTTKDDAAPILIEEFDRMDANDLIGIVLKSQLGFHDIGVRYTRYLLPLLNEKFEDESKDDESCDVAKLMINYCYILVIDLVEAIETDVESIPNMYESLKYLLSVACLVADLSRTTLARRDRLILQESDLINFVASMIDSVCNSASKIRMGVKEIRQILDSLWFLYETLPMKLPIELEISDSERTISIGKMDRVRKQLIVVDIISAWPASEMFSCFCQDKLLPSSDEADTTWMILAVSILCDSLTSQVGKNIDSSKLQLCIRLMNALLGDILELCKISGNVSPGLLQSTLIEHLVRPLLFQQQIVLIGEFISKLKFDFVDQDIIAQEVLHWFNEAVYGTSSGSVSENAGDSLRHAIECQDVLGKYLPSLQTDFQAIRRFVDASYFINTVVLSNEGVTNRVRPAKLKKEFPLDIIDFVLEKKQDIAVLDTLWSDPTFATHGNQRIRMSNEAASATALDQPELISSEPPPSIPGQLVYQLAIMLGLDDTKSAVAVKCRVLHYLLRYHYYGAGAAVLRSIIVDMLSIGTTIAFALYAVNTLATTVEYEDTETKIELCKLVLTRCQGKIGMEEMSLFSEIAVIVRDLEDRVLLAQPRMRNPYSSIGKFFNETNAEYSVSMSSLLLTLQAHSKDCVVDDALLVALTRYSSYWCIARSTRPVRDGFGPIDKYETQNIMLYPTFLLLLAHDQVKALECLLEIVDIFEEQKKAAVAQYPKKNIQIPDPDVIRRLMHRGYSEFGATKAAMNAESATYNAALHWAVMHSLDPGFDLPLVQVKLPHPLEVDHETMTLFSSVLNLTSDILCKRTSSDSILIDRMEVAKHKIGQRFVTNFATPVFDMSLIDAKENKNEMNIEPAMGYVQSRSLEGTYEKGELSLATDETSHDQVNVRGGLQPVKHETLREHRSLSSSTTGDTAASVVRHSTVSSEESEIGTTKRRLVVLISRLAFNRSVTINQERAFTTLKANKIEFETLDASDPALREIRDELIQISGLRGKYPQFFLIHPGNGKTTFWGNWEKFVQTNDDHKLVEELGSSIDIEKKENNAVSSSFEDDSRSNEKQVVSSGDEVASKLSNSTTPKLPILEIKTDTPTEINNVLSKYSRSIPTTPLEMIKQRKMSSDFTNKIATTPSRKLEKELLKHSASKVKPSGTPDIASTRDQVMTTTTTTTPSVIDKNNGSKLGFISNPLSDEDRMTLLEAGKRLLKQSTTTISRHSSESDQVTGAERELLLEQGRRLLQQQQQQTTLPPISPPTVKRIGIKSIVSNPLTPSSSVDDAAMEQESTNALMTKSGTVPVVPILDKIAQQSNNDDDGGWDFEEDNDDLDF